MGNLSGSPKPKTTAKQKESEYYPLWPLPEEADRLNVPESLRGTYFQQKFRLAFGLRSFHHLLSPAASFETHFVDLTATDIHALIGAQHEKLLPADWAGTPLQAIQAKIDEIISSFPNGAFVKLDSRSPKDVLLFDTKTQDLVKEEILKLQTRTGQTLFDAFMKGSYKTMKVTTGEEALHLLLQSSRVSEDLRGIQPLLEYGILNCIVLRPWSDDLVDHPEMEFRGFIHHNKFTALSQYDYYSLHPCIFNNKEKIQNTILEFWEKELKTPLTGHDSYIADFFITQDGQVKVIELNSFESWTGGCLFTWGQDRQILLNGPFEFRIVEKPSEEDFMGFVTRDWQGFLKPYLQEK